MQKAIRVLILEDDPEMRDIYNIMFAKDSRFTLRATHDGSHAAGMLRTEPFDLAVLDIRVPTMNGLQVAAVARSSQFNRKIPILIVSGAIDQEAAVRARAIARLTIVEKPFDPKTLFDKVQDLLAPKSSTHGFDARIVSAVVNGATQVLEFYFKKNLVKIGKPSVQQGDSAGRAGITGLIGIQGETFAASMALIAPNKFADHLGGQIFQTERPAFDAAMQADIMAELCNQLCGRLKAIFATLGLKAIIGLPKIVTGDGHTVLHTVGSPVLIIPIDVADDKCQLEFCMVERSGFIIDEAKGGKSGDPGASLI